MRDEKALFETLLDRLDRVSSHFSGAHGKPGDFGTGVPLHRVEIHTVAAIGDVRGINLTKLAERMGVTKGAASQVVARLVKKGLVRRARPEDDARETLLELTDLGWTGHRNHEQFHGMWFDIAKGAFGDELGQRLERLVAAFDDLIVVFEAAARRR